MRRELRSWLRKGFHRGSNANDGESSQGPQGSDVRTDAVAETTADAKAASLPVRLWDRAYSDLKQEEEGLVTAYEKVLSRQLQNGPGSAVPESQENIIVQNNPDARRRQMTQLTHAGLDKTAKEAAVKEGLGAAMQVALSAKDIISSAIQAVPQAALAWTGICLALELLANPMKATEANRKGLDYVVKRMDWYWSLSGNLLKDLPGHADDLSGARHELEGQVVNLYKVLLSYQVKSVLSFYRNRGLVLLRDVIKLDDWDGDLGAIRDAEKCFRDDTQTYNAQQMTSHLGQLVVHAKNQELQQLSEKDQQCLKHLRLTDPRDDKTRIERTKGGLLQDSYRWVLENSEFQRWRDGPESELLWIKGDPGKGKTMLLCGIIDELIRDKSPSAGPRNVAYFFCQATDSRINNATAVLCGLIYLLIDQQPSLLSHIRGDFDRAGDTLFKDANAWDAASRIFTSILQDPSLRVTCLVIDALDECAKNLPPLLDLIAKTPSGSSRVKWLVSSRNWPEIEQQLDPASQTTRLSLDLNAEAVVTAVNAYIGHKVGELARLKHYDTTTREQVHDYLSSQANGTFLWVALVCHTLADSKVQKWHVDQKLRTFPPGLDALYARMVDYIRESEDSDLCRRILAVVTIVRRPLSLPELTSLVDMPIAVSQDQEALERVIELCGSFLTLRDRTVYFVHQSAQEFLLGKASGQTSKEASEGAFGWVFPSGIEAEHRAIVLKSLQALSTALRRDMYGLGAPGTLAKNVRVPDPDPLATVRYSCVHWVSHLYYAVHWTNTYRDDLLQDGKPVHTFLQTKYLYWLEALSLLRTTAGGDIRMHLLNYLLRPTDGPQLNKLASDAQRFSLHCGWEIEHAPLQAYASALAFAPASNLIKTYFRAEEPDWITIKPNVKADWDDQKSDTDSDTGSVQTSGGRDRSVCALGFSADGQLLASGSFDGALKVWDTTSGRCLQTFDDHGGSVYAVAFSPNGVRLASGSADNTVKIWDTVSWQCLETLEGHGDFVQAVAFSSDGHRLASSSEDKTVKIWDVASGRCLETMEGHTNMVYSVAFSSNDQNLASGSCDGIIKIWDSVSGRCLETLMGHGNAVLSVAFSHDSQRLAFGSEDGTIAIWDITSERCLSTIDLDIPITHVSFDHGDGHLLTNIGRVKMTRVARQDQTRPGEGFERYGYGLGQDLSWSSWIACNGQNVLWLPSGYQPSCSAVQGRMVAIGCDSGEVFVIDFARDV